jgi:isoquinoline 1-oxidoreductase subunit beta
MPTALPTPDKPRSKWRRRFLITAGVLGGAMAVGLWRLYRARDRISPPAGLQARDGEAILTAWIKIAPDGHVTVEVPRQEMGQGVLTALPMLVAEELDVDFGQVHFEQSPVDPVYANATILGDGVPFRPADQGWLAAIARVTQFKVGEALGVMATGGSTSVRDAWEPMRRAGATARAMLLQAAAQKLAVPIGECTVRNGVVEHASSGKHASFGELALEAAKLPVPADVVLKDPARFRLLGKPLRRLDIPAKVNGGAQFGMDVRLPGMLYAAIAQCPVFGGAVRSYNADQARTRTGVKGVLALPATSTSTAAVVAVAKRYWQAKSALTEVEIVWDEGPNAAHATAEQRSRYQELLASGEARTYDEAGKIETAFASPPRLLEADYFAPYLAHATMEPINCTAVVRDGSCEVWVGNQSPTLVQWYAAKAAGIDSANVTVHTPFLGGGFGRRAEMDVVMQAVMLAKQIPDTSVQLIWSREEDIQHDVYRPMAMAKFRAALDAAGNLTAWYNRVVGQSCTGSFTARLLPVAASDAMKDKTTVEGAFDLPYNVPNRKIEHVLTHEPVPVGFWRSVGHSYNAFFTECFVDECANAAGEDPYEFRRALLKDRPRHRAVLELAAKRAGWDDALPAGVGRGVAVAESFHSIVAQVAEVEVKDNAPVVRRIVCAVDCGFAVNPDIVVAQMESGIVFGLTAALFGEITLQNGRVEQSNFPTYEMVRLAQTPEIEVHIVESGVEHLGGIGEPGTPPVAPAVCNALFAITGKRIRALPIRLG